MEAETVQAVVDDSNQGNVDVTGISDEELSAQIDHPTEETAEPQQTSVAETKPAGTETKGEEKPPSTTDTKPVIDEAAQLKKRVEDQDRFIQRLGTEIGLLRQEKPEDAQKRLKEIRDTYNELALTDPFAAKAYLDQKIGEENQRQQEQQQQIFIARVQQTKADVAAHVPDFETSIEDIATLMQQDGANAQMVDQFKRMPYLFDPALIVNMAKRAIQAKEIATLKGQIADRDKQINELRGKTDRVVKGIESAAKGAPTLSGASGQATTPGSIYTNKSLDDLTSWTDAELDAAIRGQPG